MLWTKLYIAQLRILRCYLEIGDEDLKAAFPFEEPQSGTAYCSMHLEK